eukprot:PITA_31340
MRKRSKQKPLLAEKEPARNFVRFCVMQRTSLKSQGTVKGSENSQTGQIFATLSTPSVISWWNQRGLTGPQPSTFSDWEGSSVDRKSTSRYCFEIGSRITSWCSRKHKFVALSSSKAEYMAVSTTSCEAIWLRKLLVNLFRRNMEATKIMCDNQSCIKLYENPVFQDRSKHIDIRCHFVRDCVQRGAV